MRKPPLFPILYADARHSVSYKHAGPPHDEGGTDKFRGPIDISSVSKRFHIDNVTIWKLLGVDLGRLHDTFDIRRSERRLADMLAVIDRVSDWAGGETEALAWYGTARLPAFGMTAAEAVRCDHGEAVLAYLDGIGEGGFA